MRGWLLLAQTCARQDDRAAEEHALDRALAVDPRNIRALLAKGERRESRGDDHAAVSFYGMALQADPTGLPAAIIERLSHASAAVEAAGGRFEAHLEQSLVQTEVTPGQRPRRFTEALDIMAGRKEVQLQQPTSFFYSGLPQTCFYDAQDFDWVAGPELDAAERAALTAMFEAISAYETPPSAASRLSA